MRRRWMQERAVRRRGELDQDLGSAASGFRHRLTTSAELEDHRVPGRVAIIHGHVVLWVKTTFLFLTINTIRWEKWYDEKRDWNFLVRIDGIFFEQPRLIEKSLAYFVSHR